MFDCNITDDTKCKAPKIVGFVLLGIVGAGALVTGVSFAVKGLWNWLMPEIFGLKKIDFLQALGITILAKLLFGSGHSHTHSGGKPKTKIIKKEVVVNEEEPEPEMAEA
ncbi:MAG: hypothetical protein JXR56_01660 [Candidatus Cloacimonetes bacterium]|nr:hypothetical protein [Candidatus Cloacimonadota bacterium]